MFLSDKIGHGYFAKSESANGYCTKRFVKRRRLTAPWNVMEWLYVVSFVFFLSFSVNCDSTKIFGTI